MHAEVSEGGSPSLVVLAPLPALLEKEMAKAADPGAKHAAAAATLRGPATDQTAHLELQQLCVAVSWASNSPHRALEVPTNTCVLPLGGQPLTRPRT